MSDQALQTYRIQTVYEVVDRTSRQVGEIAKATELAARNSDRLTTMIKGLGLAVAGSSVFGQAKNALIGYNAALESSQTVIAGMLSMYTGASIEKSWDRAAISVERFQKMAAKSSLTTKDLVDTAQAITRPLLQAGVAVSDIENLTFGVSNAAKAMGMNTAVIAMDIEQAVQGRVGIRDRFMRSMLAQKSINLDYKQFNTLSEEKRVATLKKALDSPAIRAMAEKQSNTWSGVMSTLEDNFQIALGKVGLPLFKAITAEVKGWNVWIDNNHRKIEEFGKTVAHGLVEGFKTVKSVFVYMYDHAGTLISIAKAYAAIKIGTMLGSALGGSGSGVAGLVGNVFGFLSKKGPRDQFNPETGTYEYTAGRGRQSVGGFKGVAENAQLLGASLGVGVALGNFLNKTFDLSHSFSRTAEVNGRLYDVSDKTTNQLVLMLRSMNSLDDAVNKVSDSMYNQVGAKATKQAAGLMGLSNVRAEQAEVVKDLFREYGSKGGFGGKSYYERALEKSGKLDADEIKKAVADPTKYWQSLAKESDQLKARHSAVSATAENAWNSLPDAVKKSVDQQIVMGKFFEAGLQKMNGMSMYAPHVVLDQKSIDDIIKTFSGMDSADKGFQANPPKQTVNITVQRVMAKDPNKWLAEMDDMVNRRTRAPTKPRGGFKSSVH